MIVEKEMLGFCFNFFAILFKSSDKFTYPKMILSSFTTNKFYTLNYSTWLCICKYGDAARFIGNHFRWNNKKKHKITVQNVFAATAFSVMKKKNWKPFCSVFVVVCLINSKKSNFGFSFNFFYKFIFRFNAHIICSRFSDQCYLALGLCSSSKYICSN